MRRSFFLGLLVVLQLRQFQAFLIHPHDERRSFLLRQVASTAPATDYFIPAEYYDQDNELTSQQIHQQFVVHAGRSADMIRRAPALSGITLCKGWTPSATEAFRKAISSCVKMNPILSGHVYEKQNRKVHGNSKKELWIQAGTFPPEEHEFCRQMEPPPSLSLSKLAEMNDDKEILDQLTTRYIDLFDDGELTHQQIRKRLPLFGASIMVEGDVAIFSIKMSHAIGDGVTFFELLKQVSMLMNSGGELSDNIPTIEWNHERKASHEIYSPTMSKSDIEISYGIPFLMGCAKNVLTQPKEKRGPRVFLIDKHQIAKKKKEMRANEGPKVSSNDIITAGVCQANRGADVFVFTENVRGVVDGIPRNVGGNYFWEVPVRRKDSIRPEALREVIQRQQHEGSGDAESGALDKETNLSPWPFLCGRVARVTSLASITESIVYEDIKTICTMPSMSFMKHIPLDVAVIFRYSKACWGVLHNSYEFDTNSTLLEDAVVE